jgi:hypothetical protein
MTNLNTRMYNSNNKIYVDEDLTWKAFVPQGEIKARQEQFFMTFPSTIPSTSSFLITYLLYHNNR